MKVRTLAKLGRGSRTTISLTTFTAFDNFCVYLWPAQSWTATRTRLSTTAAATLFVACRLTI